MSQVPDVQVEEVQRKREERKLRRWLRKQSPVYQAKRTNRVLKQHWVLKGRQGHAPECTRARVGRGLVEIHREKSISIYSDVVTLKCPGCGGTIVEHE